VIELVGVAVAAAIGAPFRFLVDRWVQRRAGGAFPWGTFVVNASGAVLLGFLTGLALYHGLGRRPLAILGVGFCGGYTTFSTFSWETLRLLEDGTPGAAVRNVAGSLAVGLAAATAGLGLAALM
jgi:CrcB protein